MPDSKQQQSDQKSSHGHSGEKEKTEPQQHPQTALKRQKYRRKRSIPTMMKEMKFWKKVLADAGKNVENRLEFEFYRKFILKIYFDFILNPIF
jgi:hypothetical protein